MASNTTHNTQVLYRLKVEDALSYLDQVKLQFARQPDVYNQFLDIMKEFKSQSIDTPGVISRVSNLFKGHSDLIEGFNTFLPPGYKIEVQSNDSVHVTSPNTPTPTPIQNLSSQSSAASITAGTAGSNKSQTTVVNPANASTAQTAPATVVNIGSLGTAGNAINIQLPSTPHIKIEQGIATMLNAHNFIGNLPPNASINLPAGSKIFANQIPPATTPPLTTQTSAVAPSVASRLLEGSHSQSPYGTTQTTQPTQHVAATQPQQQQQQQQQVLQNNATTLTQATSSHNIAASQVEFGHAITYVNKIKNRFQNQPDIYKAFLEILHTYQKQQKNLKDGIFTGQALSESEVYAKVAKLFKNQEDLLNEFSQFLPDANANATGSSTSVSSMQTTGTASSSVAAGTANPQTSNSSTLNETTNLANSKYLQQQQIENSQTSNSQQSTITAKTEPISATPASSTQNKTLINTQANTPSSVKASKYSSKLLKSQANQENTTMATTSTTSTSTTTNASANKNLISNMSSSKSSMNHHNHLHSNNQNQYNTPTNAIKTSSHTITSTGSVKRASSNHQLSTKKQKLSALKHSNSNNNTTSNTNFNQSGTLSTINTNTNYSSMSIHDADYINSINEVTFFEHVKKSLKTNEVYKNFLRCIALFNQEIVNGQELIKIVEPYLGKFPELYRWFKNYVDDKDDRDRFNETLTNKNQANRERIDFPHGDNVSLEIDYSSCKQYGASYREITTPYSQSTCSGRTELCKEVLNDTFVSFPCWSEDSTFLTSKKNQYEELLFRTEDERFELDVILEINLATIRILEGVQKKMMKMSADERSKFRLDNCLGGSSEVIHFKAIQRIYGDKSREMIEGIKRNPVVAVPLVLKRLKAKDEEWKEAKKNFEKQWREQSEKNYLKSLDYCAVPFKQTDQKHLKTRSLLQEIEAIYFERQEAKEEGQEVPQTPHLTFKYEDKSILEDAAALIIHHVKRQMGIQKEDKQKIKQIVYYFLPDLFFVPRGALSDDEADDEDDDNVQQNGNSKKKEKKPARHTDTNKRRLTDVDDRPKDIPEEYKSPEDMYRLFFVDDHWYLFFRYHHILCERLHKIYKHSINFAEQEFNEAKNRQKSVADALKLRNKCKIDTAPSEYYPAFLDIVRNLLDGSIDGCQYEDTLREMFGIHAYIAFTLDKVVQNCVRQLQHLVQDEASSTLRHYYLDDQKTNGNGGKVANMQSPATINSELTYQRKTESLLQDQNCFKILMYKNSGRLTVELLDTETQDNLNENEMNDIEKWSEYIEKYYNDENNQISDDVKETLLSNPVFLTRNAHFLKQKFQDDDKKDNLEVVDNTIFKFDSSSYKVRYEPNTWSFMYRKNSIKNTRKSHHSVTKRMYDRFKKYLSKWLKENSITTDSIDDWLIGETLNNPNIKTTCTKDCSLKKTPYHVIYKYKTQKLNVNNNDTTSTTSTTATTTKSSSKEKLKDKSPQNNTDNGNSINTDDTQANTITTNNDIQQLEANNEINKTNQ